MPDPGAKAYETRRERSGRREENIRLLLRGGFA